MEASLLNHHRIRTLERSQYINVPLLLQLALEMDNLPPYDVDEENEWNHFAQKCVRSHQSRPQPRLCIPVAILLSNLDPDEGGVQN